MEGGFFLIQHVDIVHAGHQIKGSEIMGHGQALGEEASRDIKSGLCSFVDGMTLDDVQDREGDTLTLWGGAKGSPADYPGQIGQDGHSLTGGWGYPGGGG